jgi:hypothetical protein
MMPRRELRLTFDLLLRGHADKEHPTIDYATNHVEQLHNNHYYACQHLKIASDALKTRCDRLANSAGFQEEEEEKEEAWLYRPTQTSWKSLKLQPSWEGPYMMLTHINVAVCTIKRRLRTKIRMAHVDRLTT